jgi:hypothetical protein
MVLRSYLPIIALMAGQALYSASIADQVRENIHQIVQTQLHITTDGQYVASRLSEQHLILRQDLLFQTMDDQTAYKQIYAWVKESINTYTKKYPHKTGDRNHMQMLYGTSLYLCDRIIAVIENKRS